MPQTLLVAVAFGTADYATGRAGGPGFTLLAVLVVVFACGAGSLTAAREFRRAELSQLDSMRTAVLPTGLLALGIAAHGGLNGSGWLGAGLLLLATGPAIVLCARIGART
ncbi:hypothetical protein LWF15_02290 [Kineosporia rhizophila]|uniref:hypothetical protein n=1 Tax=Kineosporia rhizophila TaxID=84633 RepID=UPI001E437897|nr:hypothetical protein [Kineosporia rhizophila]MCE0534329.1 hypothetical protein [Kineosporia rhizophila]